MKSEKTDRRVSYTKMVLKQSLLKLMKEKQVGKLTVKEICEDADINRGTFYSYYQSPEDLLAHIESDLFDEIMRYLSAPGFAADMDGFLGGIFELIKKNSELCSVLFGETGDKDFLKRIIYTARERSFDEWRRLSPDAKPEKMELLYTFFANGCVALISSWLANGMSEDPEKLAKFIEQISARGLAAIL